MKSKLFAALLFSTVALSACETATPYQPLGAPSAHASGGYYDHQIESNRWQVGFKGNDLTGRETVERYLLYRAAELTVGQGFDWFEAVTRHTDKKSGSYVDSFYDGWGGGYWGANWGFSRRGYGWRYGGGWNDPFWGPGGVDINQVDQFEATAEIILGHGPKPADRQAFDARSVLQHLGKVVQPPAPRT